VCLYTHMFTCNHTHTPVGFLKLPSPVAKPACVCVIAYIFVHVYVHAYIRTRTHHTHHTHSTHTPHTHACRFPENPETHCKDCVCVRVCVCVCVCMCVCVHVCAFSCIRTCICTCIYCVFTCVYMYIHMPTPAQRWRNRTLINHEQIDSLCFSIGRFPVFQYW